ncbi:MAG TPA: hypothetical protein PKH36_05445 [Flavobacteriales bacterium]|nr:hypothetical protein [Flavobacteriales bacterium]HNK68148.1 hypothetical protein [Flavobacteriales bacterium]HNO06068.1 hypothetical protein [Flavobacteriales bacterium]
MNRKLLTVGTVFGLLAGELSAQLPRIVVQGTGGPAVFTSLDTALSSAQPGDKVYLSGGSFLQVGDLVIDKQLHLIGAGIMPDSANVTATTQIHITNNLRFTTPCSGSTFTGISFFPDDHTYFGTNPDDDDPVGLVFQRCEFVRGAINLGSDGNSVGSATFDECIMHTTGTNQGFNGARGEAVLTRCILNHKTLSGFARLFMKNCVVFDARLQNASNCIVQNCVFTYTGAPLWQVSGVQISNCLVGGASMFSNSGASSETNNIFNVAPGTFFVSEADDWYHYYDDIHLSPASGGVGMGNDGTDIGIFGTHAPYKIGAMPYNPHFQQGAIDPATNWNGELPVQIRTAAQTH